MTTTTELLRRASRDFTETQWSLVRAAGDGASPQAAAAALDQLCERYWSPIYVYVRRQGHSRDDAQDLTQEFFARIIAKNSFAQANHAKGRFRYYLLGALNHFLADDWDRRQASKRPPENSMLSLDDAETMYSEVPAPDLTPEKAYDYRWRVTLLEQGLKRLAEEFRGIGREPQFLLLKPYLTMALDREAREQLARALEVSLNSAEVAVHRFRRQFRRAVRAELAETVASQEEFTQEVRELFGE